MIENATISRGRRRGATLVWVAILLTVFVGMLGLVLDWGYAFWTAQKLQNGADAAALAGVKRVWWSHAEARQRAMDMAALNEAGGAAILLRDNPTNDPNGDIVIGHYDTATRLLTPTLLPTDTNAVMVRARRTEESLNKPLTLFFGRLFATTQSQREAQITRWAIAVASGGPTYADIIALNEQDKQSFYIYGHGYLDLGEDGTAQVNSSNTAAAMYQGTNITFIYDEVNIVGSWDERGNPDIPPDSQDSGEPLVPDPLADLDPPAYDPADPEGQVITGNGSEITEFWPGYYPGGLDTYAGHHVYLHPGIYILGNGFHTNGGSIIEGYNTMFYLVGGSVKDNGDNQVYLTPTTIEPYAQHHLQFWQAEGNTEMASFNGTGTWSSAAEDDPSTADIDESKQGTGTLYFPDATLELGGNGTMYYNGLIADKIVVYGDGQKHVTSGWDGEKGGARVWLVE